jgi:eukaryotic-like serine/threonine-protein kinase
VLKQILPDIEQLLDHDIPDAPILDGEAGQQRLLDSITAAFLAYEKPIVLFLEDLQWSDESLDVVNAIMKHLNNEPVMIVGTFRSDERPSLPEKLDGMTLITLDRLNDAQIADLSVSILGEGGRDQAIIDLLNRETEGNVFFLVEVIRALADHAGQLSNIQTMTLPTRVFAQGIHQVVERRLSNVTLTAQKLLQVAAVAGRQLDLEVLKHIAPDFDIDNWLIECSNAAVLSGIDGQWQFSHEKLREGIITSLPLDTLKQKHHQIADSLIDVYSELHDEYASIISDHYEQAKAVDKAVKWHIIAGKHAQATFAPTIGIEHYRKALEYWLSHEDDPLAIDNLIMIYRELGVMLIWQAEFDEALDLYDKLRTLAESSKNKIALVTAYHGLAKTNFRLGHPKRALEDGEQGQMLAQEEGLFDSMAQLLLLQGMCHYTLGDLQIGRKLATEALEVSEKNKNEFGLAQSLNVRGVIDMNLGIFDEATDDFDRALVIFEKLGTRPSAMSAVNNLGLISIFRGDYDKAVERYQDAILRAQESGEIHLEMEFTSNMGEALMRTGKFDEAIQRLDWVIQQADRRGFAQVSETYRFLAEAHLGTNQLDDALKAAESSLTAGYDIDYQEFIAGALNVLGQVLAVVDKNSLIQPNEGKPIEYVASKCFKDADAMFIQLGMEGERARNLRTWAQYEIDAGDKDFGLMMWQEARRLFVQQGADAEVARMDEVTRESKHQKD